jgi:transposase
MSRGILPEDVRINVASEPVDLRASFDRLAAIAKTVLKKNPSPEGSSSSETARATVQRRSCVGQDRLAAGL